MQHIRRVILRQVKENNEGLRPVIDLFGSFIPLEINTVCPGKWNGRQITGSHACVTVTGMAFGEGIVALPGDSG